MTNELIFRDKSGHPLAAGDYIVYSVRSGDVAILKYGKVISIKLGAGQPLGGNQMPKLYVQGVNDAFRDNPASLCHTTALAYESRVLRILATQIPKDILELLNAVRPD